MLRYVFRDDEPLRIKAAKNADPQAIGEALWAIAERAGGELTPATVVDAARDKYSSLHPHFEWDDTAAAEQWRQEQARALIRVVRVEDDEAEEGDTRAFLSIRSVDGVAYHPVGEVRRSLDMQLIVLRQAERDLAAFQRRYRELSEVCAPVKEAREALQRKLAASEGRAAV